MTQTPDREGLDFEALASGGVGREIGRKDFDRNVSASPDWKPL